MSDSIRKLQVFIKRMYLQWYETRMEQAENSSMFEAASIVDHIDCFVLEDAAFAGGCIRDSLCGRVPKDYDFLIPCSAEANEALIFDYGVDFLQYLSAELQELGNAPRLNVYMAYGQDDGQPIDENNDFQKRLYMAANLDDVFGYPIDFLFNRELSILSAVQTFDNTMNMLWLDDEGTVRDKDAIRVVPELYKNQVHKFVKPVKDERFERMVQRAEQLGLRLNLNQL